MTRALYRFGGWLLLLAASFEFMNIVLRTFQGPTLDMSAQLAIWLVAWAVFLAGGPLLAERGGHVAISALPNWLGGRARRVMERLSLLVLLAACALMTWSGWLMSASLLRRGATYPFAIRVPHYVVKSCVVTGFAIATVYCLVALVRGLKDPAASAPDGMD